MAIELHIKNETEKKIPFTRLESILEKVQKHVDHATHESLELLLTTNEQIQELNKEYRGKDYATDVLSFSFNDDKHLGQIVISLGKTEEQAKELGQSFEQELDFLFTHGVLHLLGYDHEEPEEEQEMLQMAYTILGRTKSD